MRQGMRVTTAAAAGLAAAVVAPTGAFAADGLNGAALGLGWALPFVGMLLSIALFPLLAPNLWEHHQGKITALWAAVVAIPMAALLGGGPTATALVHTALLDYIPFILLLLALFTTAGGILIAGNIHGSPAMNTALLAIGALFASLIGTTGASMVMIRPVIRARSPHFGWFAIPISPEGFRLLVAGAIGAQIAKPPDAKLN